MAEIPVFGTLVSKNADGKVAYASQVYDEEKGMFVSEIVKASGGNVLNVTKEFPLKSGFYTLATASSAIAKEFRSKGLCITYQISDGHWETKQFLGDSVEDSSWAKDGNWGDFGGSSVAAVFNPTVEYPVSGYYSLFDEEDDELSAVHVAWAANKASLGLLMTFKISKSNWKTYQFVGSSLNEKSFKNPDYWKDFGSLAAGSENYVVINNLCGAPTAGEYYTLESAVTSLISYQKETNVTYIKTGLIISYITAENTMETKQFQGSVVDANKTELWKDFGGGSKIEAKDKVEKDGKDALSTGGAYNIVPSDIKAEINDENVLSISLLNSENEVVGTEKQLQIKGGGADLSGTIVTVAPKESPFYAKAGDSVILPLAIMSVTTTGGNEQLNTIESIEVWDRTTNQLLETKSFNQPSSADKETFDFLLDLSSYFTVAGTKKFKLVVKDDTEHTGTRNISVTAVDVTIHSEQTLNYTSSTVVFVGGSTRMLPMYKFPNNASEQGIVCTTEIYVNNEWKVLGTATISDTFTHSISVNPMNCVGEVLKHGSYPIRIHGVDVASGVVGNYLFTTIFVVDQESEVPLVAIRYYGNSEEPTVKQYDNVSVDFAVFNPMESTTKAQTYLDGSITGERECYRASVYTLTQKIQDVVTDGSYYANIAVKCGEASSNIAKFRVYGSLLDIEPVKSQLMLDIDFSGRSNSDSDKSIKYGDYTMTLSGANYSTNGFVKDSFGTAEYGSDSDSGIMALRIAEKVSATLDYLPFANSSVESNGAAIQFRVKVKNISDDDARLISCISNGYGFYLTGKKLVVTTDGNKTVELSVDSSIEEDKIVDIAIVFEPTSQAPYGGIGMIKVYFDGELIGTCDYKSGSLTKHSTPITFDGSYADLYLYNIRAWETFYSFEQSFNNYLLKMNDTDAMIKEYTFNQVMASFAAEGKPAKNRPQAQALYDRGIPYFVLCKNANTDNTDDQYPEYLESLDGDKKTKRTLDVYAYFPDRPWQDFKAVGCVVTNQGTTSSQRPIKNVKIKLKTAAITLLHTEEEFSGKELEYFNNCQKNAAKHKVTIYEDSLATNIITVKVDYSESGGANNGASTQLYNELQRALGDNYITPAQRFNLDKHVINTSINSIPCAFFRTDKYTNDATSPVDAYFHAKGNWNEDKGDAKVFGFEAVNGYNLGCLNYGDFYEIVGNKYETLESLLTRQNKDTWKTFEKEKSDDGTVTYWDVIVLSEYCGPNHRVFRLVDDEWEETTGSMKFVNGAWKITGDFVNPVENYELLKYDSLDWFQGVNSMDDMMAPDVNGNPVWLQYFESRYPDDDSLNQLYEDSKKAPYNLYKWLKFCQDCNHTLTEADGNITINGETVSGTKENRLLKWRKELHTVANVYSALCYHVFTDYINAVDQRSKNMMVGFYLDTDGVVRMYLNHLYDGDTILGSDNDCGLTVPVLLDPNTDTAYFQGWNSVLFQQNKNAGNEGFWLDDNGSNTITMRQVADAMRKQTIGDGLVPFSPAGLIKYFITDRLDKWPKLVSSFDGLRKYVEHSKSTANYFFALHGLSKQRLRSYITERFLFRDGFYQTGDLYSSTFNMRISAKEDVTIKIKAAKAGFFGVAVERVDQITDSCYLNEGEEYTLQTHSHILGSGNMMYVLSANKIAEIDISCGTVSESGWKISEMVLLRKLSIGGENHKPTTITAGALKNLSLGSMPFLEELDIQNTDIISVDATYCPRLVSLKASGSKLSSLMLAETSPISTLSLPSTMTSLSLVNLPNLVYPNGGLSLENLSMLKSFCLSGCPCINSFAILSNIYSSGAKLNTISLPGINVEASIDILTSFMQSNVRGADDEDKSICSGISGKWMLTKLYDDDKVKELQDYFINLNIVNSQFTTFMFDDTISDPYNITNCENGTTGDGSYVASGHILRIRKSMFAVKGKLDKANGVWKGVRLSDANYRKLANEEDFDYTDSLGDGFDVFMKMPACWYKGINDFKNQKKYICWSSISNEPQSTATNTSRKQLNEILYASSKALLISNVEENVTTMSDDSLFQSSSGYSVYKMKVGGMKQVRFPGVNNALIGDVFVDANNVVLKKFSMAINTTLFDFAAGDYIFTDVPENAEYFYFTSSSNISDGECIAVDSENIEAIEPEWIHLDECLGGVYEASIDTLTQIRSISGARVQTGTGTQVTSSEWGYDENGFPVTSPLSKMNYTYKDFQNLAWIKGKGYQLFDYEMNKFCALLWYCLNGMKDEQLKIGYGQGAGGTTGYRDTIGNSDSQLGVGAGNKCLGFEGFIASTWEVMDNIAVNIPDWKQARKDKFVDNKTSYPLDIKYHIYDPIRDTERTVLGLNENGKCVARVKWGRYCDLIPTKLVQDNNYTTYFASGSFYSHLRCRCVGRAGYSANAFGGLAFGSAVSGFSFSHGGSGARLAFRGKIELS